MQEIYFKTKFLGYIKKKKKNAVVNKYTYYNIDFFCNKISYFLYVIV